MRRLNMRLHLLFIILAAVCGGCAHYPDNPRLPTVSPLTGYRYSVVRPQPTVDKPFVLLGISGGGTRAAAFSFGLMEELRQVEYTATNGTNRTPCLDDVEIILNLYCPGVSFTSAYYALFPERFFDDFPKWSFSHRDIQVRSLSWGSVQSLQLVPARISRFQQDRHGGRILQRHGF